MKVRGEITSTLAGNYDWTFTTKKESYTLNQLLIAPQEIGSYTTPSSARRAANRVAKRLGLEIEWEEEEGE